MNAPAPSSPHRQHGVASVAIAMLLLFILGAAVLAVKNMSGSSVIDAAKNEEQVAALFLAESGLERGLGQLNLTSNPTVASVCTGIAAPDVLLGRGKFTLSGTPTCDPITLKCSICTITSTGTIPATGTVSSSRTVVRVVSLSAPSGGAYGCGGGGVPPVVCPTAAPAADKWPDIVQQIKVTTAPAILMSNMAYSRHPQGGANNINASGCVALSGSISIGCITQWNDESNHSSGSNVVGSRGASAYIDKAGTYQMKQNLTADSLFAAVGVRVQGSNPQVVGSYWDDASNAGLATAAGNATASGQTNNGAACATDDGSVTCPNSISGWPPATIPDPPSSGSYQARRSWCYDADTLVFGLSGTSVNNNNGALTSFRFGTAPESTAVPNGSASYPATHTNDMQIYSALRYISNPGYMSASDVVSGAVVTGSAGATFTGSITKNTSVLTASTVTGTITANDLISGGNIDPNTTVCAYGTGGTTGTGGAGTYTVTAVGTPCATPALQSKNTSNQALTAGSTKLVVSSASKPYLDVGDTLFVNGVSLANISSFVSPASGGVGTYNLSTPITVAPNTTITSNGITVTTPSSLAAPTAGAYIAVAWTGSGTGLFSPGTTVASSPTPSATMFALSARPTIPLSGAKICGGICAFFNHSSATAMTNFIIAIPNTAQWAAGMTCLKGVDTNTMTGLTGISGTVQPTNWYEPVR